MADAHGSDTRAPADSTGHAATPSEAPNVAAKREVMSPGLLSFSSSWTTPPLSIATKAWTLGGGRRLNLHGNSTCSASSCTTNFFGRLDAIGRHWEGPLTSLSIQEVPSLDRPVAVKLEQASSFIQEARELVATRARPETIGTATRND